MEPLQGLKALGISFDEWNEEAKKKFNSDILATSKAITPLAIDFNESVSKLQVAITSLLEECKPGLIKLLQSMGYVYEEFEENRKEKRMAARARRIHKMSHGKHGMKRPM